MKKLIALLAFTLCVSAKANSGSIISNSATLTVSSPALVSIAITPGSVSVPAGTPWQFTATGTYTDGTTGDLTGSATWSSSDNTVATVSAGLASSLKQGSITATASLGSIASIQGR